MDFPQFWQNSVIFSSEDHCFQWNFSKFAKLMKRIKKIWKFDFRCGAKVCDSCRSRKNYCCNLYFFQLRYISWHAGASGAFSSYYYIMRGPTPYLHFCFRTLWYGVSSFAHPSSSFLIRWSEREELPATSTHEDNAIHPSVHPSKSEFSKVSELGGHVHLVQRARIEVLHASGESSFERIVVDTAPTGHTLRQTTVKIFRLNFHMDKCKCYTFLMYCA